MDRRHALRNIGLSMGAVVVTPTIMSLLQSCQNESAPEWFPEFFTQEEGVVLRKVVDIILPKTDTPSGSEVNTHKFIDVFINEVMEPEQQTMMKTAIGVFTQKALSVSGKNEIEKLNEEDLEAVVRNALKINKEQEEALQKRYEAYVEAVAMGKETKVDDDAITYIFLDSIRGLSVWGYKNSEVIGKEVLAYDPVPGRQEGCVDVNEATGGKAWAL